ncbi:glycosyltransferase family 4 protein [Nocardioides marmoribigeumensis]|uniref:Glycosyltransferase involved in cell wall biosynthesis n=1 Tax=Nocardioides marmoribigeumensis TaxID=433649 RepID=A0ABU2BZI9_9ACTN|nr:glycosyltransferase family 4 protein [Nocardioides marmoribigeumensis]MDR7363815.1 glycosyltransferase involved in cell wall biosynthesis [Nocardioides marmoribigeumensis]
MAGPAPGRLRVTVLNPFGELGGAEYWLLRLLDATDDLEVDAVLLRDGPLRPELESRGVAVRVLPVGRRPVDVLRSWGPLRRALRASAPDVVLANGVKAQVALGPLPRVLRLPTVWVKHDHSFDRWVTPVVARVAHEVVATTEELVPATRRADVTVIHPPQPVGQALPRDLARKQVEDRVGRPVGRLLVMLSRFTPYKGIDTAIRALAAPGAEGWDLLVMGGEDPAEPGEGRRLSGLAADLGVADRVHLAGHVADAAELLGGADALAVLTRPAGPRTPGREGFGMAAMEATLAGVPVLAPDDGGPVGRRVRRGGGLLVDALDPGSVARALGELADPGRAEALRAEALRLAPELFDTAEVAAARLVRVLRDAVGRRHR